MEAISSLYENYRESDSGDHEITRTFSNMNQLKIEEYMVREDIDCYVQWQFEHDEKLMSIKSPLKLLIMEKLMRSGGMYVSFLANLTF